MDSRPFRIAIATKVVAIASVTSFGMALLAPAAGAAGPAAARRPAGAAWSSAGDPKKTVVETGAVFLNGKVYLPGGFLPTSAEYGHMQRLNTTTGAWSAESETVPSGTIGQAAVCTDGSKVYVVGGVVGSTIVSMTQVYDPTAAAGSRWSTGVNPHTTAQGDLHVRDGGCAWIGGKLYVFGGQAVTDNGGINGISGFTWVFDPTSGQWSDTGFAMLAAKWSFGYASNSTTAFAIGGKDPNDNFLRDAEKFAPARGWTKLPKLPVPSGAPAGTGLVWPGVGFLASGLVVFGGDSESTTSEYQQSLITCANPCTSTSTWTNSLNNLATARAYFGAASTGGATPKLYAICGLGASGYLPDAETTS
jgi:Kelch motif